MGYFYVNSYIFRRKEWSKMAASSLDTRRLLNEDLLLTVWFKLKWSSGLGISDDDTVVVKDRNWPIVMFLNNYGPQDIDLSILLTGGKEPVRNPKSIQRGAWGSVDIPKTATQIQITSPQRPNGIVVAQISTIGRVTTFQPPFNNMRWPVP
jgi:hypothetical protein